MSFLKQNMAVLTAMFRLIIAGSRHVFSSCFFCFLWEGEGRKCRYQAAQEISLLFSAFDFVLLTFWADRLGPWFPLLLLLEEGLSKFYLCFAPFAPAGMWFDFVQQQPLAQPRKVPPLLSQQPWSASRSCVRTLRPSARWASTPCGPRAWRGGGSACLGRDGMGRAGRWFLNCWVIGHGTHGSILGGMNIHLPPIVMCTSSGFSPAAVPVAVSPSACTFLGIDPFGEAPSDLCVDHSD